MFVVALQKKYQNHATIYPLLYTNSWSGYHFIFRH